MQDATHTAEPLIQYFSGIIPLKSEEKQLIAEKFHPHQYLKKQYALQHGDICRYFTFVVSGCLRMFITGNDGVYHTLQFAPENSWVIDLASFHKKTASVFNIDALEHTKVLRITYEDLIGLYMQNLKFDKLFRVLLENHFMYQQERMGQLFTATAEERYLTFLNDYPQLHGRLTQVQIAAYLGITPEFLSRLRGRLAGRSGH